MSWAEVGRTSKDSIELAGLPDSEPPQQRRRELHISTPSETIFASGFDSSIRDAKWRSGIRIAQDGGFDPKDVGEELFSHHFVG